MTEEQLKLAVEAKAQGAKLHLIKDEWYASLMVSGVATVWKLKHGSEEYYVTKRSCTCPGFQRSGRPCKHLKELFPDS